MAHRPPWQKNARTLMVCSEDGTQLFDLSDRQVIDFPPRPGLTNIILISGLIRATVVLGIGIKS